MARLVILTALCLSVLLGFGGIEKGGGVLAVAPGGFQGINDQFDGGSSDWTPRSDTPACTQAASALTLDRQGICYYTAGDNGNHPTSLNQFAVTEFDPEGGPDGNSNTGPALRVLAGAGSTPGLGDFSYAIRCEGSNLVIRDCNSDFSCQTIQSLSVACPNIGSGPDAGDRLGFAASSTGVGTELCGWSWDSLDAVEDWEDPSSWKPATLCVAFHAAPIVDFLTYTDCGGATTCFFDQNANGTPADVNSDVALYSGSNGADARFRWFVAGDL